MCKVCLYFSQVAITRRTDHQALLSSVIITARCAQFFRPEGAIPGFLTLFQQRVSPRLSLLLPRTKVFFLFYYRYYVLNMKGTWRVVTGLLLFWLVVLMYMSASLYQTSDVNERTERQLSRALQELDMLKKQNDDLQRLANELK